MHQTMMTFQPDTEVVVIGNGPAGISLSAFLSGWHPYYDNNERHPDSFIDENLRESSDTSLLEQDLSWYEAEYETRVIPSVSLYSDLYDRLMRPEATNVDALNVYNPSCLRYKFRPQHAVSHVVLGDGEVGGSWNKYDDNMATVSLSTWMDLPAFSLAEWMGGRSLLARLPAGVIREYMHEYVKRLHLTKNFVEFTSVTNVTKFCSNIDQKEYWRVRGHYADGELFEITSKTVVIACGRSHYRRLEVEGEMNAMNVVYNAREAQQLLHQQDDLSKACVSDEHSKSPVIVVGDGISAADAIRHCLSNQVPVVHVFRRTEKQLKGTMLSRLSSTIYPEYSKIFDLMVERTTDSLYRRADACSIRAINSNHTVLLEHQKTGCTELIPYRCLCVCVGLRTELSMLEDKHEFHTNYQSQQDPTLYAIGSAIGDHFVRYLIGGAFHVAQKLIHNQRKERESTDDWFWMSTLNANSHGANVANSEASSSNESINDEQTTDDEIAYANRLSKPFSYALKLPTRVRCKLWSTFGNFNHCRLFPRRSCGVITSTSPIEVHGNSNV
ncbi:hypothetical protein M3Y98_00412100 [Aphelenchoides besseyi]|nr:hypothetical protein M3Y98_00412100 [Aphelenchoides besseyi]KAI6202051.1 hypothetical protein M3Y96_00907300 [Aphelenchoides besseyi]